MSIIFLTSRLLLCLGFVVALGFLVVSACWTPPADESPNLIIVSLDTVRPDRLGLYGWHRPTSPVLDHLAQRAVVFEDAMAPTSLTAPSHSTLMSGRLPWRHGTLRNGQPLDPEIPVLSEVLAERGWRTAAFVSGFPMTRKLSGLDRGFELYNDDIEQLRRPGRYTVDAATAWIDGTKDQGDPYFAFVHLYDAHGPYEPPPELEQQFVSHQRGPWIEQETLLPQYQRKVDPSTGGMILDLRVYLDRYEAAIRQVDQLVGELLERVDLDNTIVLVVSDHGETLDERRVPIDHGSRLFDEQLRIVGLLAAPGIDALRIEAMVGMADFAPTLLDLLAIERSSLEGDIDGRSLRPLIAGERDTWRRRHLAATAANRQVLKHRGFNVQSEGLVASVTDDGWKLIIYPATHGDDYVELFRLSDDAEELVNLALEHPEQIARLRSLLDPVQLRSLEGGGEIDEESAARLRALGYVSNP